jgi:hypothetical protein
LKFVGIDGVIKNQLELSVVCIALKMIRGVACRDVASDVEEL